ncbi:MAG TPA: carbonic anhydrase family protein [Steroidobacteraceae bacterium]|jgi:carbonic anhydrase|nr:carbonic anhydrase family protein [Steroidobacteraceae bacterium]
MNSGSNGRRFGAAAWLAAATLVAGASAVCAEEHAHWSYSGATGPEHWASEDTAYATCGSGKHQSPIDIEKTAVASLPPIEFAYRPIPLTVTDTGHSFQVNVPPGSGGITVGADHYDLVQFHFHRPSEEEIHGHRESMVVHLVHKNAGGDLAVVAVLVHTGEPNAFLKAVFDHFPPQGTSETKVSGTTLNLGEFLPQQHGYYTFDGSLTTPPCTEHVRWFVLKSPVQASAAQVQQFAARYPHDARPVQALNDRSVKETRD